MNDPIEKFGLFHNDTITSYYYEIYNGEVDLHINYPYSSSIHLDHDEVMALAKLLKEINEHLSK